MIQTVYRKNQYIAPEAEAMDLRMEPMCGFCLSDTPPIHDDGEIPE